jgi:hypothetical protein
VATLEDDKRVLEERLAFAWHEVSRICAKLLELRPSMQTAPPGKRRVEVDALTPAELAAALTVLQRVRPLPVG